MKTKLVRSIGSILSGAMVALGASAVAEEDKGFTLDEIVVTAQKREQSIQDVPISIGVLQGSELDQSGIRSVSDALNLVGGVSVVEKSPGDNNIAIRGAVPDVTSSSTVGYYLDEVPVSFITFSQLPDVGAFDLDRIEVLRGPQGTLYGSNALNGVVRVLTNDAKLDAFELKLRTRLSSTEDGGDNTSGDIAINIPLITDKLAVRAVASYSDLSGFIDSTQGTGAEDINGSDIGSYRLKVNAQPTENFSAELGVMVSRVDNDANSQALDDLTTPFGTDRRDTRDYDSYSLVLDYDLSSFSIVSATSYIDYTTDSRPEFLFGTISAFLENHIPVEVFSQEIRFASSLESPWQWSAGGFYRDAKQTWDQLPIFNGTPLARFRNDDESESFAIFGELSRSFLDDKFNLTAGLRYFEDEVTTIDLSAPGGGLPLPDQSSDFDAVTWRTILQYNADKDFQIYGSIATGFRSGFNQTSLATVAINTAMLDVGSLQEDEIITFELGGKGISLDGLLSYDLAVYYSEWKDVQQSLAVGSSGANARLNSETASGFGVDASIAATPFEGLKLGASFGWSGLEFDKDVISAGVVLFSEGSRLNGSAEYTAAVSADYQFDLGVEGLRGVANTSVSYSSERTRRFLVLGVATPSQSDKTINGRLNVGVEAKSWSAGLFVDNLFNEDGAVDGSLGALSLDTAERLRPRTIGLQVTAQY